MKREEALQQMKDSEGTGTPLPEYKCHKNVWALKIADLIDPTAPGDETDGSMIMVPSEPLYAPIRLSRSFIQKNKPVVGGYWVQYKDGYASFSPADAFEDGYERI